MQVLDNRLHASINRLNCKCEPIDGAIESLIITNILDIQTELTMQNVFGDGTNQGTSSGAIVRITVSGGAIQSFGLTAGSDTTIHASWYWIYFWYSKSWF